MPWNDHAAYINAGSADPHGGRLVCTMDCQWDAETGEPDTATNDQADADFIASLSPTTIRAMLAVIRAAEVHLTANFGPNSNELMDALAKLRECVGG